MKLWLKVAAAYVCLSLTAAVFLIVGRAQGRRVAIERYREECVNVGKKKERQFTLLYVDEYRASSCDEAVRCVWSDCVKEP